MRRMCCTVSMTAAVIAVVATRCCIAEEATPQSLSPQLKQSLQEIDASGKELSLQLEKTLAAVKKLVVSLQPEQLNQTEVKQQVDTTVNPLLVAFEVTVTQSFLSILEKSVTGPTDPKLPIAIELMAKYFSVSAKEVQTLYTEKQMPLNTIGLGLCIASVSNKPSSQIFERRAQSKSWVEIAIENGVKPGQMQKTLEAFFHFATDAK